MNKVVTIDLNGRAYSIEEKGYDALRAYLDDAAAQLQDNPDKTEIMADFEQAIAEKCDQLVGVNKNVVTAAEIDEIIKKMGPVSGTNSKENNDTNENTKKNHGADNVETRTSSTGSGTEPRRLYRIPQNSMFRGVCTGLAAYFNIDVTVVRALFVIATLCTGGGFLLAYFVLMMVMPVATTGDEFRQAHGRPPFTAQDFIDRTKAEYAKYAADPNLSKAEWKAKMREMKQEMRNKKNEWKKEWHSEWHTQRQQRVDMRHAEWNSNNYNHEHGLAVFAGLATAAIWILFIIATISFVHHGTVFGHMIGIGHPAWVTLAFLFAIAFILTIPFRAMKWHARESWGWGGYHHHHFGGGLVTLAFLVLIFYTASLLFAPVHVWWMTIVTFLQSVR